MIEDRLEIEKYLSKGDIFLRNNFGLSSKDIGEKFEQNSWKNIFRTIFLTGSDLVNSDISKECLKFGRSFIAGKSVHLILNTKLMGYNRNYDPFSIIIEPRVYINENYSKCFYLVKFSKNEIIKDTIFLSCPVRTFTEISGAVSNLLIDNLVI